MQIKSLKDQSQYCAADVSQIKEISNRSLLSTAGGLRNILTSRKQSEDLRINGKITVAQFLMSNKLGITDEMHKNGYSTNSSFRKKSSYQRRKNSPDLHD
jgi:hypothetical protein